MLILIPDSFFQRLYELQSMAGVWKMEKTGYFAETWITVQLKAMKKNMLHDSTSTLIY